MKYSEYKRTVTLFIIPDDSKLAIKFLFVFMNELYDWSIDSNNGQREIQFGNHENIALCDQVKSQLSSLITCKFGEN